MPLTTTIHGTYFKNGLKLYYGKTTTFSYLVSGAADQTYSFNVGYLMNIDESATCISSGLTFYDALITWPVNPFTLTS